MARLRSAVENSWMQYLVAWVCRGEIHRPGGIADPHASKAPSSLETNLFTGSMRPTPMRTTTTSLRLQSTKTDSLTGLRPLATHGLSDRRSSRLDLGVDRRLDTLCRTRTLHHPLRQHSSTHLQTHPTVTRGFRVHQTPSSSCTKQRSVVRISGRAGRRPGSSHPVAQKRRLGMDLPQCPHHLGRSFLAAMPGRLLPASKWTLHLVVAGRSGDDEEEQAIPCPVGGCERDPVERSRAVIAKGDGGNLGEDDPSLQRLRFVLTEGRVSASLAGARTAKVRGTATNINADTTTTAAAAGPTSLQTIRFDDYLIGVPAQLHYTAAFPLDLFLSAPT